MSDQEFLHSAIHGSLLAVISKPHRGYWALLVAAWAWAIWSCAEYWRGNPNYSYGWIVPVLSLTYAARRLTLAKSENIARPTLAVPIWVVVFIGIVAAAIIFGLEFAREQVLHPIIVIWAIAFVPITLTLLACWLAGGRNLARGIVSDFVFPYCRSVAASFRAADNGGIDASGCCRNHRIIALVWNSGANRRRRESSRLLRFVT
jgi:hypothetical protein